MARENLLCIRLRLFTVGLCLFLPPVVSAQSSAPPGPRFPQLIPRTHSEREQKYEDLHRVILNVQVTTTAGQPALDLEQSDFNLLVDNQRSKISSFQRAGNDSAATPVRVVLVIDALNNSAGRVGSYRKAISKYLQSGSGALVNQTAIAVLSDRGMEMSPFSDDRAAVMRELNNRSGKIDSMSCRDIALQGSMESSSAIPSHDPNARPDCLDRLFNSSVSGLNSLAESLVLSRSRSHRPLRTIIIWLGRGWPLLNEIGYMPDTLDTKESFYRNFVNVSEALTEAQVTLDDVASTEFLPVGQKKLQSSYFFQGVSASKDAAASNLALQAFAWQSGGVVLNSTRDIASEIARCVADARSYYLIGFSYPPAKGFGERHMVEVSVGRSDLITRTRTIYYAEQ